MAAEWEMGMGMNIGFGTGAYASPIASNAAPTAYLYELPSTDTLRIDDLLDFSNHDLLPSSATVTDSHVLPPPVPSSFTGSAPYFKGDADSSSSHHHQHYPHLNSFPDDLYITSDEAAELEWLSKFVDDSFSDVPYSSSCDLVAPSVNTNIRADSSVPGRGARSKRTRGTLTGTAINHHATAWSSLAPPLQSSSSTTSSSSSSEFPPAKQKASTNNSNNNSSSASSSSSNSNKGKKSAGVGVGVEGGVRRCTHCASEKTPQWRTGPLGPKTLCNACGVRYKSGRLVPEYRPAASPTFVLTQHSNSHRKVLELRRQKELFLLNNQSPSAPASASRPELIFHDYEVC